jgi:UDP-N-acetylglucosamine 2-epimerase (non-hydrolysing)
MPTTPVCATHPETRTHANHACVRHPFVANGSNPGSNGLVRSEEKNMDSIKILCVAGARPNFMKIAALVDAIDAHNQKRKPPHLSRMIVHTGQHYDEKLSDIFFRILRIPEPDINLEVGSGSHALQTAEIMKRFEPVLMEHRVDLVLVVGDVNSTIACALVAVKLGIKVAHVEAGLRSFDRSMPEEINRVLTDAISDFLFTTERSAEGNLLNEGVPRERIHFVGNTMIDTLMKHRGRAEESRILEDLNCQPKHYAVLTLHRPSNVDNPVLLGEISEALLEVSKKMRIVFPVHPRTREHILRGGLDLGKNVLLCDPMGYLDFLKLLANARFVLTDSGGIQEETTVLGIPCLTIRENTERPVTLTEGTNILVGVNKARIVDESLRIIDGVDREHRIPELWDGKAAQRIVEIILSRIGSDGPQ